MKNLFLCLAFLMFIEVGFLQGASQRLNYILVKKEQYKTKKPKKPKILKKKGSYALASVFADGKEIEWAKKFDVVELGGIDDEHITRQFLKKKGVFGIKYHIGYDWMPAFYYYTSGKNRKYVDRLYKNRDKMTLNPNGPFLHCKKNGYDWCKDFYYDYGNAELFNSRVSDLLKSMKEKGFNGLFFDWASGGFIDNKDYKKMKDYFVKQNPKTNYFKFVGKFYKTLKDKGIFVVTNQAFRKEKYLLKYVAYDMTESYITTDTDKKIRLQIVGKGWVDSIKVTNYYPIYKNSNSLKDSLHFINLLTSYKKKYKKYGFKNFIYLNYLAPAYERIYDSARLYREKKPKNAIYFGYAMAKLTDNIVYGEIPNNRDLERDDVYFYDLGKPLGKNYIKLNLLNVYVRFYKNGFVLVSGAYKDDKYLKLISNFIPIGRYIYDAYNNTWLQTKNSSITIKLDFKKDGFSHQFLPTGRVYLYNQH